MTLDQLMEFAQWISFEADVEVNESCNCHPEYQRHEDLVDSETARWWREHGFANEA